MAETITRDTVMAGRLLSAGHADAKDWFADLWRHSTIRRLSCADRAPRRGRGRTAGPQMGRVWQVNAADCATLEEAIVRLNVPAVLTEDEAAFLERVPADWTAFRVFMEPMKGRSSGPASLPTASSTCSSTRAWWRSSAARRRRRRSFGACRSTSRRG